MAASLTADSNAPQSVFLVSVQPETGLHALELGIESGLRPMLGEFGVRGLLVALCGGLLIALCEGGSGEDRPRQASQGECVS